MSVLEERLETAASKLGLREPFIAAVVCKIRREIDTTTQGMTACTNGVFMKFGLEWCTPLTDEELFGLYMHESLHVILMHMWRRGDRHPGVWNTANDAIINYMIKSKGYELPKGGVSISWVDDSLDSDEVYNRLMQTPPPPQGGGKGDGAGDSDDGDGRPKGGWDNQGDLQDAPDAATQADIEATILTAAKMARDCGDTSALVNRVLGEVGKSNVRWQDEVRVMLRSAARNDFSYRRFSRRFISRGSYLPALYSESVGGLGIGYDTSGSVTDDMGMRIAAEIQGIVDDLDPDWVEVAYCDTTVGGVQRFERGEPIDLKPIGGGGTRFLPVFEHFAGRDEKVAGLIYLTDMEGDLQECVEPDFPVVWGLVGGRMRDAPFGKVVKIAI